MTKMIPLDKIKDNPYRDKKRNPIDPVRVGQLVESIEATDFWKGVYGRELDNGFVEIAFGHTRVDAAREAGLQEIPIEIMKLSDGDMLMRMTRENLRGELLLSLEAVSAAVKAYATGAVQFEEVSPDTRKDVLKGMPLVSYLGRRCDPTVGSRAYTADTLARLLGGVYIKKPLKGRNTGGRAAESVHAALGILEMEERQIAGFSERIFRTQADEGVQYLGAKKIIQVVSEVKDREVRGKERTERDRKAENEVVAKQLQLEKERKERERKAKEDYEASIQKEADARKEEDKKKLEQLRKEREDKAADLKKKEETDVAKKKALDQKLAKLKQEAEEERQRNEYAITRKKVERILVLIERETGLTEEAKALSKADLHPEDRERVRQAALKRAAWFGEYVADMFLPPMSQKKHMAEYQKKEAKRRAEEAEKTKKEKKK